MSTPESRIYKGQTSQIVYVILPEGLLAEVGPWAESATSRYGASIVLLTGVAWNDDLTPWPAPGVFRKAKPFGGDAASFYERLVRETIPGIEASMDIQSPVRILAGVSLSGLFSIWASLQPGPFSHFGAVSASLWYDGFADWVEAQEAPQGDRKVLMLLGDRERNSKDARMSTVEDCSRRIAGLLATKGLETEFKLFEGTHFSSPVPRLDAIMEHFA